MGNGTGSETGSEVDPRLAVRVTHRRYVSYAEAHYAGNLAAGAYVLGLFGDVATEVCIRTDGDEGLLAGYRDIRFLAPIRGGDIVEITAAVTRVGSRSRDLALEARVTCRAAAALDPASDTALAAGTTSEVSESASRVLDEPIVAATARATVVVPQASLGGA